ncbi:MAG: ThuA domain-containing protein [Candidatus Latescibacteria bacterium]|nr:ThuA domain-containing protein [Candidatus Latescibacterota bacterium]
MKKRDAILLAGDRYHHAEDAFRGVGPAMEAAGLVVEYTTDYAALNKEVLDGKRLLVILRDGMEWPNGFDQPSEVWMQPHQEAAIEGFVAAGGAFMPLHNAGWAYPWRNGYRRVMGGYYQGHPPILPFDVKVVNHIHPITAGVEDYEIVDEQHFLWFDYDRVDLLLKSQGRDGRESAAGWAYDYGQGRVAYLANGHTLEILQHPMVQRLLRNAVRWLLRI